METTHIPDCTQNAEDYDAQTEFHTGPEECPACIVEMTAQAEAEQFAEFGMSWVHGGGDPADAGLAWSQDKALAAQREEEDRLQRIENEVADEAYLRAVTRPKNRPVKGWRDDHFIGGSRTGEPFKGKWEYEPGCICAKCENSFHEIADCHGAYEF